MMRTFKEVFSRREERQNLKNVGFCLLVVFTLVLGSFAMASMQLLFESAPRTTEVVNESSEFVSQH